MNVEYRTTEYGISISKNQAVTFLLAWIALMSALVVLGCANLETNAYKTIGSVTISVDTAMNGWKTYLSKHPLTDEQQAPVRDAYTKYQAVMAATKVEVNIYRASPTNTPALNTAVFVLTQSATNVLQTINSFPK